ncbi:hypothetical protein ACI4A9_28535, partial [Klebsiella pneumoniae]|uniref:hypothetical protein n=1 Tax=Klebsiella pneumoniae TaxID=573 RepID=UPI0038540583
TQSKFFIRVAFVIDPAHANEFPSGKLRMSWSNNPGEVNFEHWTEAEFTPNEHHNNSVSAYESAYQTFVLEPAWSGSIGSIALEF